MAAMYTLSHFFRVSTALIAVDLTQEFALEPPQLALLGGTFFYVFALAQIPLGPLLDRQGPRRVVVAGTALGAAGALVFATSRGWPGLLVGRGLMGLGMAPVLMGSLVLLAEWFPPAAFGTLSGLLLSVGTVGALLAATPLAGLVEGLGWRVTFAAFAAATLAGCALIARVVRDRPPGAPPRPAAATPLAGLARVLSLPTFWTMAPLALVGYASVASIQGLWAGPYFMEVQGYSRSEAGHILFALGASMSVGSTAGGLLSDRVFRSRKWVVVAGNALSLLCLLPLTGWAPPPTRLSGWVLLFAGLGFVSAFRVLLYAHLKESVDPALTGTAVTAINFFIMAGPAVLQQAMGFALDARPGDYAAAFLVPFAALAVGSLIYLGTRDAHPSRSPGP